MTAFLLIILGTSIEQRVAGRWDKYAGQVADDDG